MGTTADKLSYLEETKTAIRDAIVAKGVDVPEATPFRQYADKVGEIQGSASIEALTLTPTNAGSARYISNVDLTGKSFCCFVDGPVSEIYPNFVFGCFYLEPTNEFSALVTVEGRFGNVEMVFDHTSLAFEVVDATTVNIGPFTIPQEASALKGFAF